ncbi:hypothetical protein FHX57_004594 [Paraburkholderia tropica]|uniref:EF-hand domain-containing protein n=1 Tax=Paraburkholderia tropica TaxID=92647 RepID=UPI00161F1FB8|nr:EF-hand domain-containing protein [Paraburkholderia tropica]MBB3002227.1 hypothetical protein [Paraburkholderia tropica]MBB6321610.1 hypothetical protein [Paraburkholderia tropica]
MKKMIAALVLCIVSAAATVPATALAQTMSTPPGAINSGRLERAMAQLPTRFAQANTSGDGKLTRAQAQSGMPIVAQHFDEIDTQHNGYITLAQIEDFMRERAAAVR